MIQSTPNGTVDMSFIDIRYHSLEMKNFILALQRQLSQITGGALPSFDYTLDHKTNKLIFSKATEVTASSPSGSHYRHYIATMQDDLLTEVNIIFVMVSFQHGFPLGRWNLSVQCMFKK